MEWNDTLSKPAAEAEPKKTVERASKASPVMVMRVPPSIGPEVGLIERTTGVSTGAGVGEKRRPWLRAARTERPLRR